MEEIKKQLQELIAKEMDIEETAELLFYQEIVSKLDIYSKNIFNEVTVEQFFLAIFNMHSQNDFFLIKLKLKPFLKDNFISKNTSKIKLLIEFLEKIEPAELEEYFNYSATNQAFLKLFLNSKKYSLETKKSITNLNLLMKDGFEGCEYEKVLAFSRFYKRLSNDEKNTFKIIEFLLDLKIVFDEDGFLNIRDLKNEYLNQAFKVNNNIIEFLRKLEKDVKKQKKEQLKLKELCAKRLQALDGYISLTPEEIDKYPIDFLEKLELAILEHNEPLFKKIESSLELYKGNTVEQVKKVFNDIGLPLLNEKILTSIANNISLENLTKKLEFLKKINIHFSEEEIYLLLINISLELILKLNKLLDIGSIKEPFIKDNLQKLANDALLNLIEANIELLKNRGISLKELDNVILENTEVLIEKLDLANAYNINIKNSLELYCILENDFFDAIDIWIELGILPYLEKNMKSISKNIINITKRIQMCYKLKINPFDENGNIKEFLLEEQRFYVSDKEIDNYIGHFTNYFINKESKTLLENSSREQKIGECTQLDETYLETPLTYKIGNQIISRNRVLRNLSSISDEFLIDAILFKSIFDYEQCKDVLESFNTKKELYREIKK